MVPSYDDFIAATPEITITPPIPVATVTIIHTDASTTGTNAQLNALCGRCNGAEQRCCGRSNYSKLTHLLLLYSFHSGFNRCTHVSFLERECNNEA
jgi:hypothetical protein